MTLDTIAAVGYNFSMAKLTVRQHEALTVRQHEALVMLADRKDALENEMGVHLSTVRALAAMGFATCNEFKGAYGDAQKVTHWNARITEAGLAAAKGSK